MKIVTREVNQFHKLNQLSGYVINYLCKQDENEKEKLYILALKEGGVQQTLKRYNSLKTKLLFSLNYGVHHILTNFIFWSSYPFMIVCQVSTIPREEKSPGEKAGETCPLMSKFCHLLTVRYFSIHLHSFAFLFKEELENNGLQLFFFAFILLIGHWGVPSVIAPLTHSDSQSKKVGEAPL